MTSLPREGINPLRPYYIPPSIGEVPEQSSKSIFPRGGESSNNTLGSTSASTYLFRDLDYKDYISEPSPSVVQSAKDLVDDLLWRYTSVLLSQPFEVAKLLLQVRNQEAGLSTPPELEPARPEIQLGYGRSSNDPFTDYDSDPDEPSYFGTPTHSSSSQYGSSYRQTSSPQPLRRTVAPTLPSHQISLLKPDSIAEVISQLWQKEGAWGVWKGTNASFLYTVLQSLLENWSRSLLSALFNVPDLGLKDDVERLVDIASPYPWASLFVAAAAAVATGLILSPLDVVRTRLVVTPASRQPRRALSILRNLPSYFCSSALIVPTLLHSLIHPVLTLSAPLVLRTRFMVDGDASPVAVSLAKFCSSSLALFVKLPLETVLRRGQAAIMSSPAYLLATEPGLRARIAAGEPMPQLETIVPLGAYSGVFGTMHHIVSEEGSQDTTDTTVKAKPLPKKPRTRVAETVYRRGQGMPGLWRGWKVSWWGIVGMWTAAAISGGGDGKF